MTLGLRFCLIIAALSFDFGYCLVSFRRSCSSTHPCPSGMCCLSSGLCSLVCGKNAVLVNSLTSSTKPTTTTTKTTTSTTTTTTTRRRLMQKVTDESLPDVLTTTGLPATCDPACDPGFCCSSFGTCDSCTTTQSPDSSSGFSGFSGSGSGSSGNPPPMCNPPCEEGLCCAADGLCEASCTAPPPTTTEAPQTTQTQETSTTTKTTTTTKASSTTSTTTTTTTSKTTTTKTTMTTTTAVTTTAGQLTTTEVTPPPSGSGESTTQSPPTCDPPCMDGYCCTIDGSCSNDPSVCSTTTPGFETAPPFTTTESSVPTLPPATTKTTTTKTTTTKITTTKSTTTKTTTTKSPPSGKTTTASNTIPWNLQQPGVHIDYTSKTGYSTCGPKYDGTVDDFVALSYQWFTDVPSPDSDQFCTQNVCVNLKNKSKSLKVPIIDVCFQCLKSQLILSQHALQTLAGPSANSLDNVQWSFVPC